MKLSWLFYCLSHIGQEEIVRKHFNNVFMTEKQLYSQEKMVELRGVIISNPTS